MKQKKSPSSNPVVSLLNALLKECVCFVNKCHIIGFLITLIETEATFSKPDMVIWIQIE